MPLLRKALSQLEKQKIIRKLARNLYDYTKKHDTLASISPDLKEVAKAIVEKNGVLIQPAGAHAANLVGLSMQISGWIIFLTEAASKKVTIGNQEIIFKNDKEKCIPLTAIQKGLVVLDVPLKSIEEIIDLRRSSDELEILAKNYRKNRLRLIWCARKS